MRRPCIYIGIIAWLLAIIGSYEWLDRSIATLIYNYHIPEHLSFLRKIVEWPSLLAPIAPFTLLISSLLRRGKVRDTVVFVSLTVICTFVLKTELKWVFSRYWPMTWIDNNLSWISNGAYGFQWFKGPFGQGLNTLASFPSGHTAIAFAFLLPIGYQYRQLWVSCLVLSLLEGLSMILFDYHFLSDVLAGAAVGVLCMVAVNQYGRFAASSDAA